MMQFSWAPWEAVDKEHLAKIKAAHDLHNAFSEKILALVAGAYKTGEPILRALECNYPNQGYAEVKDAFLLGEDILVAPIIQKGQTERTIALPQGIWKDYDGKIYEGGKTITLRVSLSDLPCFERIEG